MTANELYIERNVSNDISSIVKGDIKMKDLVFNEVTFDGKTYKVTGETSISVENGEVTMIFPIDNGDFIHYKPKISGDNDV